MGLPQIPVPTLETARKPERLYEFLRLFSDAVRKLNTDPESAPEVFTLTPSLMREIRAELQVNGVAPLNVSGLIGLLSQPQTAAIVVAASLPNAANYLPGTMLVLTGTPDTFYYNKSGSPNTWQAISTAPTNMMTLDTAQVVTAAGIKTIDATWLFQVSQNIINALDANLILTVQDTNNTGTAAAGVVRAMGDTANLAMIGHGTGRTLTRCGITLGGWTELFGVTGSGLLIDKDGNFPVVFGTNGVERARFLGAGGAAGWMLTVGQLIQMVGAIGANTTQLEIKKSTTDGGASTFKVDYEGDVTAGGAGSFGGTVDAPDLRVTGPNGSYLNHGASVIEEITLSTVGATTDSVASLIPGNCKVLFVGCYISQTISGGGVTSIQIGEALTPSATRFGTTATLTAGTGLVAADCWKGSVAADADGPLMYSSAQIRITAVGGIPTQGKIKVVVFYEEMVAPTS